MSNGQVSVFLLLAVLETVVVVVSVSGLYTLILNII